MRCLACDCILTDYESTRKSALTNEYTDLCNRCFVYVEDDMDVVDRPDLEHEDGETDDDEPLDFS